jgi:transposase
VSIVGDVCRFPTCGHFAAFTATAPLDASSGDVIRHRHNRGGNRQINKVIHVAAVSQIRNSWPRP